MGFMPSGWNDRPQGNPLVHVVAKLSTAAKQAMYAAAKKGLIHRGSWDGCAFNKAGEEAGWSVRSTATAAKVFGMTPEDVGRFITTWDRTSDFCSPEQARRYLIEAIETAGICTPPGRRTRVIRGYAFKGAATKFQEELESGELTVDMIDGCKEIGELLSACPA